MSEIVLIETIQEYARFLASSKAPGASHWAMQLSNALAQCRTVTGVARRVVQFYGGMGSINDIAFSYPDKDYLRYRELNERMYSLARAVLKAKRKRAS